MLAGALCVLVLSAAVSVAQDNPFLDEQSYMSGRNTVGSEYDPQGKMPRVTQVEGALFSKAGNSDVSAQATVGTVTSYDDSLFDVSFRGSERGLAGGARCEDSDPDVDLRNPAAAGCVPVLYELKPADAAGGEPVWSPVALPGGGEAGFVGAIDWIDATRAVVVGGTGIFPRREIAYDSACQDPDPAEPVGVKCDPAGQARAWLLDDGVWCEMKVGASSGGCPELPADDPQTSWFDGMRGLTAVGFKPSGDPEVGFAGGLGQLWRWKGGRFDKLVSNHSPIADIAEVTPASEGAEKAVVGQTTGPVKGFLFRVRDLRFAAQERTEAYAVTSGCCTFDRAGAAAVLTYSDYIAPGGEPLEDIWRLQKSRPYYPPVPGGGSNTDRVRTGGRDGFYSLTTSKPSGAYDPAGSPALLSVLITTPAPREFEEPRSETAACVQGAATPAGFRDGAPAPPAYNPFYGGAKQPGPERLLAIDGETAGAAACPNGPAASVGEFRSATVKGRGRRGLVFGFSEDPPAPALYDLNYPLTPTGLDETSRLLCPTGKSNYPCVAPDVEAIQKNGWTPTDKDRIEETRKPRRLGLASSYTLNSLDVLESGNGWAVGDHGAILRLRANPSGPADPGEPQPPPLEPAARPLADADAFDAFRPLGAPAAGEVPALATRPVERLDAPRLVSWGSPDASGFYGIEDVAEIVMSRDGSQGWAIGANPHFRQIPGPGSDAFYGRASLYRYAGAGWERCDPRGVEGELEPDPECADLKALANTTLVAAARVPYENDAEPENDDDFEVVAITSPYNGMPTMVRFEDGRGWRIDDVLSTELAKVTATGGLPNRVLVDVAFTAPDDGWVLGRVFEGVWKNVLFHWDGRTWSRCEGSLPGTCAERLPNRAGLDGNVLGLEAAGDRVYMYGWRYTAREANQNNGAFETISNSRATVPLIVYRDRGQGVWTDGSRPGEDGGGYDPGFVAAGGQRQPEREQGKVIGVSVAETAGGGYAGWALGEFQNHALATDTAGPGTLYYNDQHGLSNSSKVAPTTVSMRLGERDGRGEWSYFQDPGALGDLMSRPLPSDDNRRSTEPRLMATLGDGRALIAQRESHVLFGFEPGRERFEVVEAQRPGFDGAGLKPTLVHGGYQSIVPDGEGGFWAAVKNGWEGTNHAGQAWFQGGQVYFFHYTDRAPEPVFDEVPQPLGGGADRLTALAGSADGSVWIGTDGGRVARYDRVGGWEALTIPGWDPGEVVTKRTEVAAVAVNDSGVGVAVGPGGRIADLSARAVALDPATGRRCGEPPCAGGYGLRAAAVAPDGSALAGGDAMALAWRPGADGDFRRVARAPGSASGRVTAISYPSADHAYLATSDGYVYAGRRTAAGPDSADGWDWGEPESVDAAGDPLGTGSDGNQLAIRALAIAADGHGYAVGDGGLVLERDQDGSWVRVRGPGTDDLRSVTLAAGGEGALIGGEGGVVWTRTGDGLEIARPADYSRKGSEAGETPAQQGTGKPGSLTGAIVGVALLPGVRAGEVEAWAGSQARGQGTNRLFHYASDPAEPALRPEGRVEPLPDAPAERPGEVRFAAFGNTDCDLRKICYTRRGTLNRQEVLAERIVDAVGERLGDQGFALFTGDATYTAGLPASSTHRSDRVGSMRTDPFGPVGRVTPYGDQEEALAPVMQRQWNRMIADPLERAGVAVYATPGPGDLSRPLYTCAKSSASVGGQCGAVADDARTGDNLSWRDQMGVRAAPWGKGEPPVPEEGGGLEFAPVPDADGRTARELPEQRFDPDGDGPVPEHKLGGGARTHYAVDVSRGGRPVARIVAVDSSLRSVGGSDQVQQPVEPDGQLRWLERMICPEGATIPDVAACTLAAGQQPIVLTNTPTYAYGTTSPNEINSTDGIRLEALLIKYHAAVVVSGRLGWNARYWATAPGVHCPAPGGAYQDTAPAAPGSAGAGACATDAAGGLPAEANGVAQALAGLGTPSAPEPPEQAGGAADEARGQLEQNVGATTGVLPFVVAGGGGGPLGTSAAERSQQKASAGYWNGYTIVRLDPSGDPRGTIVEQRPIFDWIHLTAPAHVLRPGQKMTLKGVGREPIGYGNEVMTRFDELNTAAITHRYDLVMADPQKPYLPLEDANGDYVPVPAQVASVDRTTGALKAGRGRGERTYTIAILSVGEKAASWPIAFEPRRSFAAQRARLTLPAIPRAARAPAAQQPIRLSDVPPPPAPPPATPPGSPLSSQTLQAPAPPELPSLPTVNAAGPPPPPTLNAPPPPPAPPAPPPTPPQQQPLPLSLNAKLQAVSIVPSVNPPAPPPVNPAPPGGAAARKEAKQKQAAVAKSEEGAQDPAGEGVDTGQGSSDASPDGLTATRRTPDRPAPATRRAPDRPAVSFSPLARHDQPSAWSRAPLYGGGLGLAGLALALGFTVLRPRPRRREPPRPAPALARSPRRPWR